MKKSLVALAALAATGAFAQSTVTLSGGVSMGYTKATTARSTTVTQKVGVGGVDAVNSNSFILTAVEDLGGGLKATALIQQRLAATTGGNQNADKQTGDLALEVAGGFGSVKLGKYTFLSHSGYNPFASRLISSTSTTAGVGVGGDNTLSYTSPSFGGFTAAVGVTLAADAVGTDATGLRFNYAAGPLNVQLGMSRGGSSTGTAESSNTSLGATYDFGVAKLFATAFSTKAGDTVSGTAAVAHTGNQIGISAPIGALTVKASLLNNRKGTSATSNYDRASVGMDYALSKRTSFIAEFANDKAADTGTLKTTNYFVGLAHTF